MLPGQAASGNSIFGLASRLLHSLCIGRRLSNLAEQSIGLFFLLEGLVEKLGSVRHAELRRPGLQQTITSHLVVFDGLTASDQNSVARFCIAEFL